MMTKNFSKSFKGTSRAQRLPPMPILAEQQQSASITNNEIHPKPSNDDVVVNQCVRSIDEDELETSRIIFQKSQRDVLDLLNTFPPNNRNISRPLKTNIDNGTNQGQERNSIFDSHLASNDQHETLADAFPSPLSDRLPSSRYCRRSVSSACSHRSSILFYHHAGIPTDINQLRRDNTFDTLDESFPETTHRSLAPLPPIISDSSSNLTKSLNISTAEPLPSISPPLVTTEETAALEETKKEFTRRLISGDFRRHELTILSKEKSMNSPTIVQKSAIVKPLVVPRTQKSVSDNRRGTSVERHPPTTTNRNKPSTAASGTSINPNCQRVGNFPLGLFQPSSKSIIPTNINNKKTNIINNKPKISPKINTPKLKSNSAIPDDEIIPSTNDVSSAVLHPSPPTSNETSQVATAIKTEELLSSTVNKEIVMPNIEQSSSNIPEGTKHHQKSRGSAHFAHRASHPVPKPLTLQGENFRATDCPQTSSRNFSSAMIINQRRGSLNNQPLITELFQDQTIETQNPIKKSESVLSTKPTNFKIRKQRQNFVKSAKVKKPGIAVKPKTPAAVAKKVEMKCQSTNTDVNNEEKPEEKPEEKSILVAGTDWIMTVKPQIIEDKMLEPPESFEIPTVDDEDIPYCVSPTDNLATSQATAMTTANDLTRRNSIESFVAVEISPVLAQTIEQTVDTSVPPSKPTNEPTLMNSDIRTVFETVQDSIRKDSSFRSLPSQSKSKEISPIKSSLSSLIKNQLTNEKTLRNETSISVAHTYNNSDTEASIRPAFRIVNDSLNSRGSETIESTSSHEDYTRKPLCTDKDCDEVYRTAQKGRQVGRGAYGIVWSYLTKTGRMIAVKEIELDENDGERVHDDYESVREEINILRALNHPFIVKFLGITLENTRLIKIFMEYLPNGTIENLLIQFGPLHNDILKKYTRQIVEGVAYLHENGVVHRDIKGRNIMLDIDGNIKLIDFGCAKRLKSNQNTHSLKHLLKSMKGTANWMAPEVIGETGHGKKADIWSIGCTLHEMATGKPPWSSEHSHLAVLLIIANGTKPPADLPNTCPASAQEFFRLCLTRDQSARPSANDLLIHPFISS